MAVTLKSGSFGVWVRPMGVEVRGNRFRSVLATGVAASALLAGGCSSGTNPRAAISAHGIPRTSGTAAATPTGTVHLTDYTDNDGSTSTVILTGAIGDYGKAQSVNPNGTVNTEHTGDLDLALARGSFRLRITELDKKFVGAMSTFPPNTATCSGTTSVTGIVPIVADSGTGAYRGITGTFRLTLALDEVDSTSDCSTFLAQIIVMTGSGSVTFD